MDGSDPALAGVILDAGFTGYADIAKKVAASRLAYLVFSVSRRMGDARGREFA